ncbi:FadR/GntR family transcriptional regulator [Lichenifustis flavocetrariae]|uniref:FadR family transcriptional regulator n=1 Tax=Lichenifustis flavocetrariae TaxID=2949735 RepID=A0AA41YX05_9HYPH|nr:FadR/GntR family transcriptional regulator [Lichenifustis flavocetrariae]MCW6508850.1 FadR family transcriptional regulator [Lichenifustis flavocetrariae]
MTFDLPPKGFKMDPVVEPFQGERPLVSRAVSDHLQALILRGGLRPGDKLPSQRDLAEKLGVSRPSLREAISVLEVMGLVKVRIGSGVYVNQVTDRAPLWRFSERCSPRDVYEAREGLESHAARLAALRCDEPGAARLKAATEAMRNALAADDIPAMAAADAVFHDSIFDLAANPVLAGMYRPVRDMMVETQRLPMTLRIRLGDTLREHEEVCDRIAARDSLGAETSMRNHIRAAARRYGIEL